MPELHEKNTVKLIQLTDTHIFSDTEETFDGINTSVSLDAVIEHVNFSGFRPDIVIVTGDLVHDPVPAAYDNLVKSLKLLNAPVFCLPGNHDNPELMKEALPRSGIGISSQIILNHWHIILLNTYIPDTHSGRLGQQQLEYLDGALAQSKQRNVLICLHHPPVSINSPWMDAMSLENPEEFFTIVDRYSNIKAILWGHIHQDFNCTRDNILLMATPSTCVQFRPETEHYIKDEQNPGYRQIILNESGLIETSVIRVDE